MKAVVAAFNQEKALVGAFSVLTNLRMELFQALFITHGFQWDGELIFPLVQITLYLVRSLWLDSKHLRIMDDMIGERRRVQT